MTLKKRLSKIRRSIRKLRGDRKLKEEIELEKSYDPRKIENKWYPFWLKHDLFRADPGSEKPPFSIVIPPPNVTGSLHIGHALVNILQDIIVRFKRMKGFDALWIPGTDHAGIVTQYVVERELAREGLRRKDLGREEFVRRVWQWKEKSGGRIVEQLKRLGASCDWSRERFTLDPDLSRAVRKAFVTLYNEGLIYRDYYLVNWCPRCQTALSDLEVEHKDTEGKLYYIKYPLKNEKGYLVVATTRPETMLGDTALAVNPKDERYAHLIGKKAILPIIGRELPIIGDGFVDPEFGTGIVKVTPAHDPNDFTAGKRHNLPQVRVIDDNGRMTEEAGPYAGLDRYQARKKLLSDLADMGLIEREEDYHFSLGHCYRCGTVIEPSLSTQWFVRMKPLAKEAIKAVSEGRIKIFPEVWKKTYFEWLRNIHDWCISRQIWWGHRIPAWYCDECGEITVAMEDPTSCSHCGSKSIHQDEDVLDTWFSSALWPFSTLGWPQKTKELTRYYPTSVLITGYDILFFWVARMIMMGLKFMGDVPFYKVFLNGLVRDERGEKMSKSKGNVVEPDELIEKYGVDTLRFTLAALTVSGTDIPLSLKRMEGYRHFVNKIWNAARFTLMNLDQDFTPDFSSLKVQNIVNRWILSRFSKISKQLNDNLEEFRFQETANVIYQFTWHEFCDWYIEMVKPLLSSKYEEERKEAQSVLLLVLEGILKLLHPLMPFVTEEIWQKLPHQGVSITVAPYPERNPEWEDEEAERILSLLQELIVKIRNVRAEMNVPPASFVEVYLLGDDEEKLKALAEVGEHIERLARVKEVHFGKEPKEKKLSARSVVQDIKLFIPLKGVIDLGRERKRLEKEIKKTEEELVKVERKLSNEDFLKKAPPEVVEKNKGIYDELMTRLSKLRESLESIKES